MNPAGEDDSVTFTATVSNSSGTGTVPVGSVQFELNGTNLGAPVTLSATGTATISSTSLATGTYTVTAVFSSATGEFSTSTGTLSGGQVVIAQTYLVTNTNDSGPGSLRAAIDAADAGAFAPTITFASSLAGQTIYLTTVGDATDDGFSALAITAPMTIDASTAPGLVIAGPGPTDTSGFRIFFVKEPAGDTFTLKNVTVSGGDASGSGTAGDGGGLFDAGGTTYLRGVTIRGNTAIDGGGLASYGGTTTLTNCTVSGNSATIGGGLMTYNNGSTVLTDCIVSDNTAQSAGGGVFNDGGTTTLTSSTVSGNTASNGGGGLYNKEGTATLTNSTLSDNMAGVGGGVNNEFGTTTLFDSNLSGNKAFSGGGLYNVGLASSQPGTATLTNCTVSGNMATGTFGRGGGIENYNYGTITLNDSTVSGNSAHLGGGLENDGAVSTTVTLTNCTVSNNSATEGGGVDTDSTAGYTSGAKTTLINSAVSGNTAQSGGGIFAAGAGPTTLLDCTVSVNQATGAFGDGGGVFVLEGVATLTNCTVSGNTASANAGGLWAFGQATLIDCTVSDNSARYGGGIQTRGSYYHGFHMHIGNTIVAGNMATNGAPDVSGFVNSQGTNLIGKTDGSTGWLASGADKDLTGTVASPLAANLGLLGYYGGPTETMPLFLGSPAINDGNNGLIPSGITTDQRGTGFPRILNGTVDIGAYETPNGTKSQTVSFAAPAGETFGAAPITLTATASSGLGTIFAVKSGPATVAGDVLTITGAGTVVIEASQPGNATYFQAVPVDERLNVAAAATTTTVVTSLNPAGPTQPVVFTATVYITGSTSPATDGSVQFSVDGTKLARRRR